MNTPPSNHIGFATLHPASSLDARHDLTRAALFMLLVSVAALGGGCVGLASSTMPPRLSVGETATIKAARLPFTVGVERDEYPAYSDALVKILRDSRVFAKVDHLERFTNSPSLVAHVEQSPTHGSTVIPVFTLLTFGLIPTCTEEEFGYAFSLSAPDQPGTRVAVEYSYRVRTTLGWIAVFQGLSPDVRVFPFDPERSNRFKSRLALAILDQSGSITKLTERTHQ